MILKASSTIYTYLSTVTWVKSELWTLGMQRKSSQWHDQWYSKQARQIIVSCLAHKASTSCSHFGGGRLSLMMRIWERRIKNLKGLGLVRRCLWGLLAGYEQRVPNNTGSKYSCCNAHPYSHKTRQSELANLFSFYSLELRELLWISWINRRLERVALSTTFIELHIPILLSLSYTKLARTSFSQFWDNRLSSMMRIQSQNACLPKTTPIIHFRKVEWIRWSIPHSTSQWKVTFFGIHRFMVSMLLSLSLPALCLFGSHLARSFNPQCWDNEISSKEHVYFCRFSRWQLVSRAFVTSPSTESRFRDVTIPPLTRKSVSLLCSSDTKGSCIWKRDAVHRWMSEGVWGILLRSFVYWSKVKHTRTK